MIERRSNAMRYPLHEAKRKTPMHKLGHTRSANRRDHLLHTPDTFVRTALPGMERGAAIVHISPAAGAAFTQIHRGTRTRRHARPHVDQSASYMCSRG